MRLTLALLASLVPILALAQTAPAPGTYGYTGSVQVGPWTSTVTPSSISITATTVTLAAGVSRPLVGVNTARRYLSFMVTGTNPMTVAPGPGTVTVGAGWNFAGAPSTGQPGGTKTFESTSVPTNAFSAISAAGTTVVIWEGTDGSTSTGPVATSTPGGGPNNTADMSDPNNAYLANVGG